ncbi:MAG TPA: pyridoxamine 5'-phosphate oxidase family protein [Chitinophagaceae bacterium]|nr:pyridoxamine 5'-phosphate oxidase family protein [Chitinophagaceae bacterium]
MLGQLSSDDIENLLHTQIVGRIGCNDDGVSYIVPISYAYDGECIYCHSYEGKKIDIMRKNPRVCFQVDETTDLGNWKSVIACGEFKELNDREERHKALQQLLKRRLPIRSSVTMHLGETWPFVEREHNGVNDIPGIVFKILLQEKTGRFEQSTHSPLGIFT